MYGRYGRSASGPPRGAELVSEVARELASEAYSINFNDDGDAVHHPHSPEHWIGYEFDEAIETIDARDYTHLPQMQADLEAYRAELDGGAPSANVLTFGGDREAEMSAVGALIDEMPQLQALVRTLSSDAFAVRVRHMSDEAARALRACHENIIREEVLRIERQVMANQELAASIMSGETRPGQAVLAQVTRGTDQAWKQRLAQEASEIVAPLRALLQSDETQQARDQRQRLYAVGDWRWELLRDRPRPAVEE